MAPDMWQAELGEVLPGLFDSFNLDMKQFMELVVQIAEESRDERVSLAEYTQMLANENYVSEDEVLDDLEQRVDWELRIFAEKAELETKLRYEQLERYRAARKATDARERERRKQMAERRRETRELRDLQQRTLKQIQWLARNQYPRPRKNCASSGTRCSVTSIFSLSAPRTR